MENPQLWDLMNQAWDALSTRFEPIVEGACAAEGIDLRTWGLLIAVMTFEPEETTPGHLMVRSPYTSSETFIERLDFGVEKGLLTNTSESSYCLTKKGKDVANHLIEVARREMVRTGALPLAETKRLAQILDVLVKASLEQSPPPDNWSIRLSHKLMPSVETGMPFVEQAFSCLAAYRDDAHLAAWQDSGLSAMALESLTLFWRSEAASVDDLCRKLARRGHGCNVYVSVLEELRGQGLVHGPDESPEITAGGRVFRNQVENDTDRYFFGAWSVLTPEDRTVLARLLKQMLVILTPGD